jgi:selenide,water dikinase
MDSPSIKLTHYAHGAGCGCKLSPAVLDQILSAVSGQRADPRLLVGNRSRDDAAVYDLGNGQALVSTTDFFTPIVDDAYEFGRIAAANAVSDIYAMGGSPLLAIAILGWPIQLLPPALAGRVVEGGRSICEQAGIPLAGGHSIDSPEPIFGLAVSGLVGLPNIRRNDGARAGDLLFITKGIGVGILTTAEKKGILKEEDRMVASRSMQELNQIGEPLGKIPTVHAMTDITGFGLLGHLREMCSGSGLSASIFLDRVPLLTDALEGYIVQGAVPGGTQRNWASYGREVFLAEPAESETWKSLLADPQTNGGLLIAVAPDGAPAVQGLLQSSGYPLLPLGRFHARENLLIRVLPSDSTR